MSGVGASTPSPEMGIRSSVFSGSSDLMTRSSAYKRYVLGVNETVTSWRSSMASWNSVGSTEKIPGFPPPK